MSSINTISLDKLTRLLGTAHCPALVDVRTEEEYREVHILGAASAPLEEFDGYLPRIPRDRLVILY